ncbi:hypothetical protein FSP39_007219 [Pinctada imbricata]|uniref:Cap-specific mRNA (nucleoside-2'-O-)-methyltransferase 2 n=1 Tax=Pinctada imbricata TaxID=66713 RepID=A0AA88XNF6_PINIB|nr:hypothetical protein FSP39_007219 [Pinctada imbricata]
MDRKRKSSNTTISNLDLLSRTKAEKLFQKKASYVKDKDIEWHLPNTQAVGSTCPVWTVTELQDLKLKLNNLKDKLSDKEISEWHSHTQFMNFAGNIVQDVRQQLHPELCTQAWCKFYEIISTYDLVDFDSSNFNTVHLCEAPGAFVTSLNHFLISNEVHGHGMPNTLNPWYEGNSVGEMIDDDHFIRDTADYWYFGPDNTGNIMDLSNLKCLVEKCQEMGNIHLVTADGSIDCQDDPAEQELVVSRLHICEALTTMSILAPGGHMVLKKFTMFECDTICLMYILNCMFSEVHLIKPASSKSGNSEVYIVCKEFLAPDGHKLLINRMCEMYFDSDSNLSTPPRCMFAIDQIPGSFLHKHINICTLFTNLQGETIQNNLDHYPVLSDKYRAWIESVKEYCAEFYFNLYNVRPVPDHCRVVPFRTQKKIKKLNGFSTRGSKFRDKKRRNGTFNDRQMVARLPWKQRIQQMEKLEISPIHPVWFKVIYQSLFCIEMLVIVYCKRENFCMGLNFAYFMYQGTPT